MDEITKTKLWVTVRDHCTQPENAGIFSGDFLDKTLRELGVVQAISARGSVNRAKTNAARTVAKKIIDARAKLEGFGINIHIHPSKNTCTHWRLEDAMMHGLRRLGQVPSEEQGRARRQIESALLALVNGQSELARSYGLSTQQVEFLRGKAQRTVDGSAFELQNDLSFFLKELSPSWPEPLRKMIPALPSLKIGGPKKLAE